MGNKTYAVVDTLQLAVVVANFDTYNEAYSYVQTGWTYIVVPTVRPVEIGCAIAIADRCLSW